MNVKREPVVLAMSILAGLQMMFGGLAGITVLSGYPMVAAIAALGTLVVASAQFGVQFWVRGQVVPAEDVTGPNRAIFEHPNQP